ncbi:hypothetical protein [Parahaliea mediterranea]|uniref:hypothetical protein n=1 Tax=Parahaliea mediterranea TaxID=651086 RepID=UPI0013003D3F|nr:hypothetical protein [Parahaliea mediterranea]
MPSKERNLTSVHVLLPAPLAKQLKQSADQNLRSLNKEVQRLLIEALEHERDGQAA